MTAPLIIADAPARAQIQKILNFNGTYGCNLCEIKTQRCKQIKNVKNANYYPYIDTNNFLRTGSKMEQQRRQVEALRRQGDQKTTIMGVKGTPAICALPDIDIATCFVPEYMHSVLLGVARQMITLWLTKSGPWNIGKYSNDIDEFLLRIKPLDCFNRMPRRITIFQSWKASEFYNSILYYSLPVLVKYLPHKHLEHFILLVKALYVLLQKSIEPTDLECADKLLILFVKQFISRYSDREISYNLHQLLHLVLSVRR